MSVMGMEGGEKIYFNFIIEDIRFSNYLIIDALIWNICTYLL